MDEVKIWEEEVVIPTYEVGAEDPIKLVDFLVVIFFLMCYAR